MQKNKEKIQNFAKNVLKIKKNTEKTEKTQILTNLKKTNPETQT